ncbi:MAG: pyridoxal 5'-phosphate synthase, partial [Pirellulales bacterium]
MNMESRTTDARKEYEKSVLIESDMASDPLQQFAEWYDGALAAGVPEPEAMTLSTATRDGRPSARIVLLRGFDREGFRFFTNYSSRKGKELADNPCAAITFHWPQLEQQVRIEGSIE